VRQREGRRGGYGATSDVAAEVKELLLVVKRATMRPNRPRILCRGQERISRGGPHG